MTLKNKKDPKFSITVLSKRNKILTNSHGFIVITKGNHNQATTLLPEILSNKYIIPENVTIED